MISLLHLVLALALSSTASAFLTWACRKKGLFLDQPDPRKVHVSPVPRCGGIAVCLGALVPLVSDIGYSPIIAGYIAGGVVIALFGIIDDYRGLNFKIKFAGQIAACITMMQISGLQLTSLGELLPGTPVQLGILSSLATVFLLIAIINAINFSDGLDGLAGGISLLILTSTALLAFLSGNSATLIITLCAVGGIIGFLRLNVHPAVIFMGDTGSQFLGYTIGTCLICLTQAESIYMYSPLLLLFLLGTPLLDLPVVICLRLINRTSLFQPDKNHLHHRLLRLQFPHAQSVLIIYGLNICILLLGISLRFVKDYLLISAYIGLTALFLGGSLALERSAGMRERFTSALRLVHQTPYFLGLPKTIVSRTSELTQFLFLAILAVLFLVSPLLIQKPIDFIAWSSLGIAGLTLFLFFMKKTVFENVLGFLVYLALIHTVYAFTCALEPNLEFGKMMNILYGALAVSYCLFVIFSTEHVQMNWINLLLLATTLIALATPISEQLPELQNALPKVLLIGLSVNIIQGILHISFIKRFLLVGCVYSYCAVFIRYMF